MTGALQHPSAIQIQDAAAAAAAEDNHSGLVVFYTHFLYLCV